MKKIVILHAHNTYNYGSFMMCINLINYLAKSKVEGVFYVDLQSEDDFQRLKDSLDVGVRVERLSFIEELLKKSMLLRFAEKFFFEANRIKSLSPDAIIVLGGDDLSEYYAWKSLLLELRILNILAKKSPVFLVGQTIGPFTSWRKSFAKNVLRKCKIYTRDSLNVEYLKENLGLKDIFESSDLAFLDLPCQNEHLNFYQERGLKKDSYIVLVPSGLVKKYTESNLDYINGWVEVVKSILRRKDLKDKKIVFLPHVLKPEVYDDRVVISKIIKKLDESEKKRILYLEEELLPSQARSILGASFFSVTGRMHAAISTFQMGKPSISLSYSVKYGGIIGKDLKRKDLIVEAADSTLWSSLGIVGNLEGRIDFLMENYEEITKEVKEEISKLQSKSFSQLENIAELLKEVK